VIDVAGWRAATALGQTRDPDGTLVVGGVRTDVLARAYGTPLLILDRGVLDETVERFANAARRARIEVAYAGKALLFTGLARYFAGTPIALDVCSLGELHTAERAGFPAERMHLHGCGKSDEELEAALDGRVGAIVVDNVFELERLASRCGGRSCAVVLRVNVGIEAHTHDFVRTAGENTKFGMNEDEFERALAVLAAAPALRLLGVHSHIGSQIFETEPLLENVGATFGFIARAQRAGLAPQLAILGGGLGVDERGGPGLDLEALFGAMRARADEAARSLGLEPLRLGIEPGRAMIAQAGTSLYRVVATKRFGKRRFVIVDGGLADNPRPALYGAFHQPLVACSAAQGPASEATICGRSCENDEMVEAHVPADLQPGDLLAMATTGAYTFSMASNYNRFARPAVVWAASGTHDLAVRRESLDDITRNDV
jgi:diaminopimelate decarboxylase